MTRYPTLPAVDAFRSGWLFSSGKDAKTVHASPRCAPVRSLSTAMADGGQLSAGFCTLLITQPSGWDFFEVT
jgi:hypothetical protein